MTGHDSRISSISPADGTGLLLQASTFKPHTWPFSMEMVVAELWKIWAVLGKWNAFLFPNYIYLSLSLKVLQWLESSIFNLKILWYLPKPIRRGWRGWLISSFSELLLPSCTQCLCQTCRLWLQCFSGYQPRLLYPTLSYIKGKYHLLLIRSPIWSHFLDESPPFCHYLLGDFGNFLIV